jgi:nucleotide-binding universal stress UspA family protein
MFEHILVPLDGSSLAECVLPHVVAIAQAFDSRATLLRVLEDVHISGQTRSVDPLEWHMRKTEASTYLDKMCARLREVDLSTEREILEGPSAEQIIEFAHNHDVSLIVLSSHGLSGLSGWNISSVVQKIILRAWMPTMIVRAYQFAPGELTGLRYRRLLVPLDGSARAETALPLATTLAHFHKAQLLLVHVVRRPEIPRRALPSQEDIQLADLLTERNRLEAVRHLEQLQAQLPVDVQLRLPISNNVAAALHELVAQEGDVDLIVLSAHGYSEEAARWPLGNRALNLIAYGTTPLLIVQDLSRDELEKTQAEMAAREYKGH